MSDDRIAPVQRECAGCKRARHTTACGVCRERVCAPCTIPHQLIHATAPRPERSRYDGGFAALQTITRDEGDDDL